METIDSMERPPHGAARTNIVEAGTYSTQGKTLIMPAEFLACDCAIDELAAMEHGDSASLFSEHRLSKRARANKRHTTSPSYCSDPVKY